MTKPCIAFLGTGLMGGPMAIRLAQAGYTVRAWNRTASKAANLVQPGLTAHTALDDALTGASMVISMLEAGPVVANVMALATASLVPSTLWIDMSSTQQAEALSAHAAMNHLQCDFLDAPVSGGVAGAQAGTLAIMVGGTIDDFARAEAVLTVMGRPTLVGPVGSGQVAKLCNQLIVGGTINIIAEALLLAQAAGADPSAVRAAIRGGFAESKILEMHGQRMLDRNFMPGGKVKSQLKDLRNVLVAAADAGMVLPLTALVADSYASIEQDFPRADHSAALLALEKRNPGQRLGEAPDQLPD